MSALKEGSLGALIYGGVVTFVVGMFGGVVLSVGSMIQGARFQMFGGGVDRLAMACFLVSALGLAATVFGLIAGSATAARSHRGRLIAYAKVRVVARYALDSNMVMHTTEDTIAYCDRPKFYVRLDVGTGENEEYQCAEPVFWQAGEGMWGEAHVQGKWLGAFLPLRLGSAHLANEFIEVE